jgi:hypothetical protein
MKMGRKSDVGQKIWVVIEKHAFYEDLCIDENKNPPLVKQSMYYVDPSLCLVTIRGTWMALWRRFLCCFLKVWVKFLSIWKREKAEVT